MRREVTIAMLAALLLALTVPFAPSLAQPGPGPRGGPGMERGGPPDRPMPPPDRPGRPPDRGWQGGDFGPRHGLSPDERRQLRRDISDHGRDIYREPGERREGRRGPP